VQGGIGKERVAARVGLGQNTYLYHHHRWLDQ
jgi:hypothetical protein